MRNVFPVTRYCAYQKPSTDEIWNIISKFETRPDLLHAFEESLLEIIKFLLYYFMLSHSMLFSKDTPVTNSYCNYLYFSHHIVTSVTKL